MDCVIKLPEFEGPLDLLLYLVHKNEMDIFEIPLSSITDQFLDYVEACLAEGRRLNPEFLFMASVLIHLKSRLLIDTPSEEDTQEIQSEITTPLTGYLSFREAASRLNSLEVLFRDVFPRRPGNSIEEIVAGIERELEVDLARLTQAFRALVKRRPKEKVTISPPRWTVREKFEELRSKKRIRLRELASISSCMEEFLVYFMALLELVFQGIGRITESGDEVEVL
ncbi:MAG: segregation and condensation protein A [Desulfatiglandales bacterium]